MLHNKRGYIFLDMGTGKTATSLWFTDMLITAGKIKKVLIVAPLSTLRSVWANEIQKICPYRKYAIVHGNKAQRIQALESKAHYFITNTDAVRTYADEFAKAQFDVLLVDEITDFANATSARSKKMQWLASRIPSVYGLSGNPLAKGLIASFGLAKIVRPDKLPNKYFTRYRDMILSQVNMYEYVPRPGALGIVNQTLQPAIKYSLEECVELPPIVFETRSVELPSTTIKLFKEMVQNQIAEYKDGLITAQTAGVKAIRLIQIVTGFTKTEEGEILKTDCGPKFSELIDLYHESGNKLVVFAQGVETVKQLKAFFIGKKIECDMIYGEINPNIRNTIIERFQSTDNSVLVAQVRTMSHGITLTKSHTIVFFGPIAGNETYRQAIRRIRRIGQTHRQRIVKLVSTRFEEEVFKKLDETEMTAQAVLAMYEGGMESFI
jgi:SNF2 family DNA or RNA helicase